MDQPDLSAMKDQWRRMAQLPVAYPLATCLVFVLVVSLFFLAFPGVDIWFSSLFYKEPKGFYLRNYAFFKQLRDLGSLAVIAVVIWLLAHLVIKLAKPEYPSYVPPRVTLFLLGTLVAGPALLVNFILKDHWGRPRPVMVDVFGGKAPYVEVWRITDYCHSNCSFVSGETASAFWLMALALVVPRQFRVPTAIVTGVYAALLSFNRILFGGHFLSDVLLSMGLTLTVVVAGYRLFITNPPAWLANDRLEAGLTRFGERLHRRRPSDA
ncbi:MAG: phosphatase PAP2 family protein [Bauldia sp.]|nr:phosphatase PAP2 family protein [Bauldia sp.]